MKTFFILYLLLTITGELYSQKETTFNKVSFKTDYLRKSKNQKIIGWILLGSGTTMMITGVITARNNIRENPPFGRPDAVLNGAALTGIGAVLDLGSIPFFIASAKNKGRAYSVFIDNSCVPHLQQGALVYMQTPEVKLILSL